MPCYNPNGDIEGAGVSYDEHIQICNLLNDVTRYLCEVLTIISRDHPRIMDKFSRGTREWWLDHSTFDRDRIIAQQRRARRDRRNRRGKDR